MPITVNIKSYYKKSLLGNTIRQLDSEKVRFEVKKFLFMLLFLPYLNKKFKKHFLCVNDLENFHLLQFKKIGVCGRSSPGFFMGF